MCFNARMMQLHCREEHGLLSERRVGAPSRAAHLRRFRVPWREGVRCQQLVKKRKHSWWVEVCDDEAIVGAN